MSKSGEKLQDAIGLVSDEYILEAHGLEAEGGEPVAQGDASDKAQPAVQSAAAVIAAFQGNGPQDDASGLQSPSGKRTARRIPLPVALAACLVIVIGVGAFAYYNMVKPGDYAGVPVEIVADSSASVSEPAPAPTATEEAEAYTSDGLADEAYAGRESSSESYVPGRPQTDSPYYGEGQAYVLTAGVWNDNENWAFFTNLVNAGTVSFPSFGIDPTHRVKVTVTNYVGMPLRNEAVVLVDASGKQLWTAKTNKDGVAYLFFGETDNPAIVACGAATQPVMIDVIEYDGQTQDDAEYQNYPVMERVEDVTLVVNDVPSQGSAGLQVMFIVDTTGSMADEIAYLQKDFASIARDVGGNDVTYSVNFYRDSQDEYVTKCYSFTNDIALVQELLDQECAEGGGDAPEAVAQILTETITNNSQWRDDCNKVAFLIFDAPPHEGTDLMIQAAVRSAAERGIRLVPVVASNADRETELFGRSLAICTDGTYVFLTDDSGVGNSHLEPIVGDYDVRLLHDVIVEIINDNR